MKSKLSRITCMALAVVLCISVLAVPVHAGNISTPMIVGELANSGDSCTYEIQIDHGLYPEVVLFAFAYSGTGNATITVYNEENSLVSGTSIRNRLDNNDANNIYLPGWACYIRSSEGTVKNYTVTVKTETGDVGYAINFGTEDAIDEGFGGLNNAATVTKNVPSDASTSKIAYFKSFQALLNDGDWYRYTADGYTYITARITNLDCLAFDVYDASDLSLVYRTTDADRGIKTYSDSVYTGYVQKGLELKDGNEYLIKFYSTSHLSADDFSDTYFISVGYPFLATNKISYTDPSKYYVPANTTKTFYINVSDSAIPTSARAFGTTTVYFTGASSMENTYITSCTITAPNGDVFIPTNGKYYKFSYPTSVDYLTNINNIPILGTWKVTIRTSKALNFTFKITGSYSFIMGNDGN